MPKAPKQRIAVEDYNRIQSGIEIVRIEVDNYSGKVIDRERISTRNEGRVVKLEEKARFKPEGEHSVAINHCYSVTVSDQGGEQPAKLMTLNVEFRLLCQCREPFTQEFFDQYRQLSLRLQTGPFARAWIHDHCLRMGITPLIMPLVRTSS